MITLDLNSPVPIEEQIRGCFHQLLLKGQVKPGDILPEPEQLAGLLHVSPWIVSRAYYNLYKEGFLDGVVVSFQGRGNTSRDVAEIVQELFMAVESVRKAGLSWEEIESVLKTLKAEEVVCSRKIVQKYPAVCPYCRESVQGDTVSCLLYY